MNIEMQRIYGDEGHIDGYRVLVDRIWPRGITKDEARLDDWWKDLAPSTGLRKWFNHDPEKWGEFRKRYLHELSQSRDAAREHLKAAGKTPLVLLYGAKDDAHNNARVLKEYLGRLG